MKQMIKILSVLLLLAALFVGCDQKDASAETEEVLINDETPHESVEAKLENFLTPEKEETALLNQAIRQEGSLVSQNEDGDVLVLRTADVDTSAVVTETFTVYNAIEKKAVLLTSHTYKNGHYDNFDWNTLEYRDCMLPESVMDVSLEQLGDGLCVIKVATAKITALDEKILEENENACKYAVATSYEYYDIGGQFLAKTTHGKYSLDRSTNSCVFGTTCVSFDMETGKAIRITNGEAETRMANFHLENEKYGYYFYYNHASYVCDTVEVYSKNSGNCILRYSIDSAMKYNISDSSVAVLDDGDIFIQNRITLPEDTAIEADYYVGESKYKLEQILLDVETGATKALRLGFVVVGLQPNEALNESDFFKGFSFSEHALNLAVTKKIENKQLAKNAILILDNNMDTMYEMPLLVPEHDLEAKDVAFGLELLQNGDYLVSIGSGIAGERAIVKKDGTLRAYLPTDSQVFGNFIITEKGIFDYDMTLLYAFEDEGYEFAFTIGDTIVVSSKVEYDGRIETSYHDLQFSGSSFSVRSELFFGATLLAYADDYIIVKEDKYVLYNANFEHLLTSENQINVIKADGNYLAYTLHEDATLVYVIE